MKYQYAHDISGKIVSLIFPTQSLVMQENLCGILFLLKLNQRKLKRKQVEGQRAIPFNSDPPPPPLWNNNKNAKNNMLRIKVPTQYSPLRNSLFFLIPVSLKCYTSPPSYPLAGGESPSPAPPNCQGVETYNISDYIPVRNIPKTKGADTVIPLGNDFQSPPQKVSSMGEAGKGRGGGGGLWILNGIALTWKTC